MSRAATAEKRAIARIDMPITLSALANHIGVNRQRLYALAQRKRIKTMRLSGGFVVPPDEANRIIGAATVVNSTHGNKLLFNLPPEEDRI
jgi:hypothetical protein